MDPFVPDHLQDYDYPFPYEEDVQEAIERAFKIAELFGLEGLS